MILDEKIDLDALTLHQRVILRLRVQGLTNKEIGAKLNISLASIDAHVARLREQMGIEPTGQHGLITYEFHKIMYAVARGTWDYIKAAEHGYVCAHLMRKYKGSACRCGLDIARREVSILDFIMKGDSDLKELIGERY